MRKRRKGACREQRMLGQMRPDEEEKRGRKIQERHGRTGEYKTKTERKERQMKARRRYGIIKNI